MKYKNIKTGTVIETECVITGENWEKVSEPVKKQTRKKPVKKEELK